MRTGGAFEEDADVDDGGADADLCESRLRRTTRQERQQWGRHAWLHRQSSGNCGRNHCFCGAKKSANTVYES